MDKILSKYHFKILTISLIGIGLCIFLYKYFVLDFPLLPVEQTPVWSIEAQFTFDADKSPVKASLLIPRNPLHFRILNQQYVSKRFGVTTTKKNENQVATFAIRRANGSQELFYRVTAYRSHSPQAEHGPSAPQLPVKAPSMSKAEESAVNAILSQVQAQSADNLTLVSEVIKRANDTSKMDQNIAFLLNGNTKADNILNKEIMILSAAKIPALNLQCIDITQQGQETEIIPWLAVWIDKSWTYFNPISGEVGLPENYFTWAYGNYPLVNVQGANNPKVTFSVVHEERSALGVIKQHVSTQNSVLLDLSLFSLSVKSQTVYKQLLMIPMGVFIILLLRCFIGIKTFGTFMPILIALAFRETHLFSGLLCFSIIVSIGLCLRFYLEQFKLLLVPRLSSLLIAVIILIAIMNIALDKLGLTAGLSVALFPMVILTMTIEKMSVVWEERSAEVAIRQGIGSLFAASLGYLVMKNEFLGHFIFMFPEFLLIILAIALIMGRYQGYRLVELYRFRHLLEPKNDY